MSDRARSPIALRPATIADSATIAALVNAAFAEYRGRLVPEAGALAETANSIASQLSADYAAILAEHDGRAVGCVLFKPEDGDLYLGRLAVPPGERRAGVAPQLVAAVEDEARRRGFPAVRLGVRIALPANQRLFARLGYVEVSRHAHDGFVEPTWIRMRKPT